ncbi:MAG: transposase [Candidatus Acidiferrales bacterium]
MEKVFDLPRRLRAVRDTRSQGRIPAFALTASLFLAAVLRVPSLLQLEKETARKAWRRLIRWKKKISDDAFDYELERYNLEDLRQVLVSANQTLKRNKALEPAKIHGLLVVALDANEQFKSRHRCCEACCQRQIEVKDACGQTQKVTEYYHRQVYAQIHGPHLSTILDLEPVRPGEDEAAAALRLLGRMRRLYGPRFFDVITVDAWYSTGPFVRAVRRLGWGVVSVLKQERYDIYQEAGALSAGQKPQIFEWNQRTVRLREVKNLPFTDTKIGEMRVVLADEQWRENQRRGPATLAVDKSSHWRWLVDSSLDAYAGPVIHQIGHQRWGVENHAFNELTKFYHLTHCPHHHPVAIVAWLLFRVLGFIFFEFFARLNSKLWREGRATLQDLAKQLDRALEAVSELQPLWSG